MSKCIDLTGQKFGKLTVIERVNNDKSGKAVWRCECECGNAVKVLGKSLRTGNTQSCGCIQRKKAKARLTELNKTNKKHGHSHDRIYKILGYMKDRCYNPNNEYYHIYGAEGKTVCDEWLGEHGAENFIDWAEQNGYANNLTIDRIDNTKGYSPENCRWVDMKTQSNNKRNNHFITYNGTTCTMKQWAEKCGINYSTLENRINKLHWSIERALTTK